MSSDLQHISSLLQASLDPRTNKDAERALEQEEQKPGFSVSLLHVVANESASPTVRLAGALFFKNFLKRNWIDEDGNHKLPEQESATIKQELIGLMIATPANIQAQLGDAVSIIADSDFFRQWDTLVDDLVSRLTADNPVVNNGVLQVAHSIFKRWRPLFRSDELFTEILHVLERFGTPFLTLLQNVDSQIEQNKSNKAALKEWFGTLNLMMKLFYDLSSQDLPPVFEDHLADISRLLHKYLKYDEQLLHTDSDDESGPLEFVRAGIFEVLQLYVRKYDDAFSGEVSTFIESSWTLLTTIGEETKYDILVSKALQFLEAVTHNQQHASAFNNEQILGQVVEKVILPNLKLRESDLELFEDEPIEFIRRDLEGSDSDTRRRAATDFLRSLMTQYEQLVTGVVSKYVDHFLADFSSNPAQNWRSKDTAVYLFSSIAAKGVVTSREGVKTVNPLINVIDFFQKNIANDLVTKDAEPILKVDAIKYLYTFRSQISKDQWSAAFPLLVQHLGSSNYVVYTYAAIAVERVLALTDDSGQALVGKETVQPLAKELLEHLFTLIEKENGADKAIAATKIQENEFLMRCVMRVLIVIKEGLIPLTDLLLEHFVQIVDIISVNPSNPRFCYYLFEAIGAVVRFSGSSQPAVLESKLYAPFAAILQNDVQDFMPYVFQLFAALLEANPSGPLPELYRSLIPLILKADYWKAKGNVPALVRLLSSILNRAASEFVSGDQIVPVLGIFQQLFQTKANELQAFELLESILLNFPPTVMEPYYVNIFQLIMGKFQSNKTEALSARFTRLYHFISANIEAGLGADFFVKVIENVQQGLMVQLYLSIILPGTPKSARPMDRKIAVISLTKTLTHSQAFAEKYAKGWGFTCDRLLELLINPPVLAERDDIVAENDVDDAGFGVGFTALVSIRKPQRDYWPEITNVKPWVGEQLKAADSQQGGKINKFVEERLTPESKQALLSVMQG